MIVIMRIRDRVHRTQQWAPTKAESRRTLWGHFPITNWESNQFYNTSVWRAQIKCSSLSFWSTNKTFWHFTVSLCISFQGRNTSLWIFKVIFIVLAKYQSPCQRQTPVLWQARQRRFAWQQNDSWLTHWIMQHDSQQWQNIINERDRVCHSGNWFTASLL